MKNYLIVMVSVLFLLCSSIPSNAALIESTFDTGNDGWTTTGAVNFNWRSSGGNPGGFLHFDDAGPDGYAAIAPGDFLGDLTSFNNGYLSFDYRAIENPVTGIDKTGLVRIYGANGDNASLDFIELNPPSFSWTTYQEQFVAADWGKTDTEWVAILSDVTEIRFYLEPGGFPDQSGLDNVRMGSPVPIPGAFWLFGSGIVGISGLRRKKLI